jgi:tetratricopeptide (TPR) repeat protein
VFSIQKNQRDSVTGGSLLRTLWYWGDRSVGLEFRSRRAQIGHEFTPSTLSADARSRYELALKYESEGDDEQALTTLNEATAIDQNFADAYLKAAFVANQIGNEDQALEYLNRAKSSSGKRGEHQKIQMDALEAELTASRQEAMSKYRLLVDAYPTDVAAQYYYADFAMQNRSGFEEAQEALEQCLKVDSTNRYCEFDRMMLYVLTGDFDKAIALYRSVTPTVHYPWFDEPFARILGQSRLVPSIGTNRTTASRESILARHDGYIASPSVKRLERIRRGRHFSLATMGATTR